MKATVVDFECVVGGCVNRVGKRGEVCTESSGGTVTAAAPSTAEESANYVQGLCVDGCQRPFAAGMKRCAECYAKWVTRQANREAS